MLKALSIQNYALIDHLNIEIGPGFSIITGETGAGKSILLGALALILGQRADTSVLRDTGEKCVVEGYFSIGEYHLQNFFSANDLDYDEQTIIRREISPSGKSRAFINDTPVNLSLLKSLGDNLIDIHSQHQNLVLADNQFQLEVVDAFAGVKDELGTYSVTYQNFRKLIKQYNQLKEQATQNQADQDYFQFQFEQLDAAKLQDGEQDTLEEELKSLTHAEEIKSNLTHTSQILSSEGNSVLNMLKEVQTLIGNITNVYSKAEAIESRIESTYIELKDLANEAELMGEQIELDPRQLEVVNERLDLIYTLQQKHRVNSVDELIGIREDLKQKLEDIVSWDDTLRELSRQIEDEKAKLEKLAKELSDKRNGVLEEIETKVTGLLMQLGIPNARFKIRLTATGEFLPHGKDELTFLFSANKQSALQDIIKVASGGEMSRLMLAIKSLIASSVALPTIIFDEIDAGVSGEVANKVGNIMKQMAQSMQVINITHLPQIAGKGDHHFLVYKEDDETATHTYIKRLTPEERINEIAKMLSGEQLTDAALDNARELLQN